MSGLRYYDYVREHVFEPAGMTATGSQPESDTVPNSFSRVPSAPRTLAINAGPNQQFRVDVLAPTAAADSMADADLRATVFETRPDAPARRGPTPIRYDLSPWAGQTVRLRIATADNQAALRAGIDNVRLILDRALAARSVIGSY